MRGAIMNLAEFADLIINLGKQYGYLIIFLAAIGEGVGLPIPDGIILAISGSFVISNQMSVLGLIIYFLLGSIVGNFFAYSLGRWGKGWAEKFKFTKGIRDDKRLKKVDYLFERYGAWALLITQIFSRVIRVPIIYAAGAGGMNIFKYLSLCTLGNLIWGLFWIYTGLYVSSNIDRLQGLINNYKGIQFIVGGVLLVIFYIFYKKAKYKV